MISSVYSCFPRMTNFFCLGNQEYWDGVTQIYRPPRGAHFDYAPYRGAIEWLSRSPKWVGVALAKKEDGSFLPVYIHKERQFFIGPYGQSDRTIFSAYGLDDDRLLGKMWVEQGGILKVQNCTQENSQNLGFSYNRAEVKNIGVILLKSLLEETPMDARIHLKAVGNTPPYYYKLGFRVVREDDRHLNETFGRLVEAEKIVDTDFDGVDMELPAGARKLWAAEIAGNPIRAL